MIRSKIPESYIDKEFVKLAEKRAAMKTQAEIEKEEL